ncbi:MAG: PatB family C-S lyase [Silicimonas sp.]|nr:PatB family C-S lyase [Silicimonas sp.]
MDYDFDTPLPLRGRHVSKFDNIAKVYGTDDPEVIPMWVADMDFAAAPAITAALQAEVDLGFAGYFGNPEPVSAAVADWYAARHGWSLDPAWVRYTHGVVSAYGDVIAGCSEPGDGVIVFSPVYHAFFRQIEAMGRVVVESPLVLSGGRFEMDLEALEASLTGKERIVTFCSPHNPGGRIWEPSEIKALADFCARHDLTLISDEIHMDLTFPGVGFTPTAVAAPEHLDRLVVITAASKGFNIAGAETGLLIAPDAGLRAVLDRVILDRESSPNRYGMAMLRAAFGESGDWSEAVRGYIAENYRIFAERINGLPGVSVMEMQATYLAWVDFNGLGMSDKDLLDRVIGAKVAPNPGTQFGAGGSGHLRFNLALPRPSLMKAIAQLEAAFTDIQ